MGKPGKKLKKIFLILGITGAVYGGFKYLPPLVVPFLCAYLAALWMGPSVRYFERRLTIRLGGKERRIPAAVIGGVELLFMGSVPGLAFLSWQHPASGPGQAFHGPSSGGFLRPTGSLQACF